MKKILLVALGVIIFASPCLGEVSKPRFGMGSSLYNGKEYPVKNETFDKVMDLESSLDKLDILNNPNISNEGFRELNYFSVTINDSIDKVISLLALERAHAYYSQFNHEAIRHIGFEVIRAERYLKTIPETCDIDMKDHAALPAEIVYFEKVKDISKEAMELLKIIDEELKAHFVTTK